MACLNIREMQGYLEDREDVTLRQTVEGHLPGCVKCRSVFDRLAATNLRVNNWLSELASPQETNPLDLAGAYARVRERAPGGLFAPGSIEMPWYVSLFGNVRDLIRPEKLPPLEVTSRPVPVKDIWGLYANDPKNRFYSIGIHVAGIALLLIGFTSPVVQHAIQNRYVLTDPNLPVYRPEPKPSSNAMQGGGGGGAREQLPMTKGQMPKAAARVFVPPAVTDHKPVLSMDPSILAPPETPLPQTNLNNWGDPLAKFVNGSNGGGSGGGMGNGRGSGIGDGTGHGYGPGNGGGLGGEVYRPGRGVIAPIPIYQPQPEYSEEARKAKYSGSVILSIIVDTEGHPRNIQVVQGLGMGLDEKAVEAVMKWRFKPGMRAGIAVSVIARVEVNFRLL